MTKFSYIVKNSDGQTRRETVDADSKEALIQKLHEEGLFIVDVTPATYGATQARKSTAITKKRSFRRKGVKLTDLLVFSRQLATMLEAGVPLVRSLNVISTQIESKNFYNCVIDLRDNVEQGESLSSAMGKKPKIFNQFWVSLVEVGEASGTIPDVLLKLTFYLEQQAAFKSAIISGIIYPAILFCVATGAVAFFALVVGPKFKSIFDSTGVELPLITSVLMNIFDFINKNLLFLVGGAVTAIVLFRMYAKTYHGRMRIEKQLFAMPITGDVFKNIIVERFAAQMSILIDSGVPILYALDITERLVDNHTCALVVADIKEAVKQGELLGSPMERSGFFPAMCVQMIVVGEETGELSKMLKHVAAFYQENVETFMKRFSTVIEPFMLVFMGAVIGTIVVAMFMPMFNLSQIGGAG